MTLASMDELTRLGLEMFRKQLVFSTLVNRTYDKDFRRNRMAVERAVARALRTIIARKARTATVILSPTQTVVVSRRHKIDRRNTREEFVVTIGKPNYDNRAFIKAAKKAGEPFPIRNVLVKDWPKKVRR